MDYELAKRLKEAGFPQKEFGDYIFPDGELIYSGYWNDGNTDDGVYPPILEELIEACGEKFHMVEKLYDYDNDAEVEWQAWTYGSFNNGVGKTPIEAVAKLWLELNNN